MRTADEQLMHRVRGGDSAAMEPLVRRHASELLSFVTRMVRDSAEAEDVFQDVWFAVWRKRTSFDTTRRFRPWLFRIAANRCIDRARRRRPRLRLVDEHASAPAPDAPAQRELLDAADDAIRQLGPQQREVVVLRLMASLDYAEIADVLCVTESTVRSNMSLALTTLRRRLAGWQDREVADDEPQARRRRPSSDR